MSKREEIANKVKELESQLFDEQGNLKVETPTEEPAPEPEAVETEPAPPEPVVEEKKYKDAVKAMNEAQREAAELRKAQKAQEERQAELEKRLNEILAQKVEPPKPEPEDELESDLPDVVKIAEKKARKVRDEVLSQLEEIKRRQEALEKVRQEEADKQAGLTIIQEVTKRHPDYHEVVNSDGLRGWLESEAPPIYRSIYEGKVPATAADISAVLDHYKSTLAPPKVVADKPSDKKAPVNTPPTPSTKPNKPAPPTTDEIIEFQNRGHHWSKEKRDDFNARLEAMFKQ